MLVRCVADNAGSARKSAKAASNKAMNKPVTMETTLERAIIELPSVDPFAELCYVFNSCKTQPNPANVARVPIVL
jgi:hypothetical protein